MGETLTVLGRSFTVREIITTWADPNLYPQYVLSVKGETPAVAEGLYRDAVRQRTV